MHAVAQEMSEELSRALGEAVVGMWGRLPQDVQCRLFEGAINSQGEPMRPRLAIFLHGKHARTSAAIKARAMLEPDSLGG